MGIIRFFVSKSIFVNLVAVFVVVLGLITFLTSAKEVYPQIKFGYLVITTLYPQAGPEEIEKLITIPIENALDDIDDIKTVTSWTSEGISMIGIELESNVKDVKAVLDDVKADVDKIQDLPGEADDPDIFEISSDMFPVLNVSVSGGADYRVRREVADRLLDQIEDLDDVGSVDKWGLRDRVIWVEADKARLNQYGLTLFNFVQTLKERDISMPAGNKTFGRREYALRFLSPMENADDVRRVIIRSNEAGNSVRVADVAEVVDGFADDDLIVRAQGERAILLSVNKPQGRDSIKISRQVRDLVKQMEPHLPDGVAISFSDDSSVFLKNRLEVLYSNGLFGGLLVILMLVLLLRPSVAVMTALGMPVAFAAAILVTHGMGISLNLMTVLGFILVLGMLVDDAIVVGENVYRHLEMGKTPKDAAIAGASEMILPVIASVTTTMAAFLPLLIVGGMIGEFLSGIPKVIVIALGASLVECFFILPSHLSDFVRQKTRDLAENRQEHWFHVLREVYGRILTWFLRHRLTFGALILVLFVAATLLEWRNGFTFTDAQSNEIQALVKTDQNFSVEDTERVVQGMERIIQQLDPRDLEAVIAYVGMQESQGPPTFAPNLAHIKILLQIEDTRLTKDVEVLAARLRAAIGQPAGVRSVKIDPVKGGPPVGDAIAVDVSGADYGELQTVTGDLMARIREIELPVRGSPGGRFKPVTELTTDFERGKEEIRFLVDENNATLAGVSLAQASTLLRAAVAGIKLKTVKKLGEDIDVMVRMNERSIGSLDELLDLRVPNAMGNRIPLRALVRVERGTAYSELKHKNGKKSISIQGSIDKTRANANVVNQKINGLLKDWRTKFPHLTFEFGGEQEAMMEGFADLGKAFLVAFLLIFIILATLFDSLVQPVVIMLAIPFGFVGVMLTLFLHGMPISFMAGMGFVGLTGVVVNDSLIMVNFINRMIKDGAPLETAVVEGAKTRLRPILLTTVTTSAGLFPLAYGWFGGNEPLIAPMALVFAWGLVFATTVTLFVIPSFFVIQHNGRILLRRLFRRDLGEPLAFPRKKRGTVSTPAKLEPSGESGPPALIASVDTASAPGTTAAKSRRPARRKIRRKP